MNAHTNTDLESQTKPAHANGQNSLQDKISTMNLKTPLVLQYTWPVPSLRLDLICSDLNPMNITPFLLTRRITKLIRSIMTPDILRHLLPGYLGWLSSHRNGHICLREGGISRTRRRNLFRVGSHCFAEELDLVTEHQRISIIALTSSSKS